MNGVAPARRTPPPEDPLPTDALDLGAFIRHRPARRYGVIYFAACFAPCMDAPPAVPNWRAWVRNCPTCFPPEVES